MSKTGLLKRKSQRVLGENHHLVERWGPLWTVGPSADTPGEKVTKKNAWSTEKTNKKHDRAGEGD